jgi:hypothetical protein
MTVSVVRFTMIVEGTLAQFDGRDDVVDDERSGVLRSALGRALSVPTQAVTLEGAVAVTAAEAAAGFVAYPSPPPTGGRQLEATDALVQLRVSVLTGTAFARGVVTAVELAVPDAFGASIGFGVRRLGDTSVTPLVVPHGSEQGRLATVSDAELQAAFAGVVGKRGIAAAVLLVIVGVPALLAVALLVYNQRSGESTAMSAGTYAPRPAVQRRHHQPLQEVDVGELAVEPPVGQLAGLDAKGIQSERL